MANTYTLTINKLRCNTEVDGLQNVVSKVYYEYTATNEDGASANTQGIAYLDDADPTTFVEFQDLTEDQVVEWMGLDLEELKAEVDGKLTRKLNPPIADLRAPWLPPVPEEQGGLV